MYLDREELAKLSEEKTDNILEEVEDEVQEIDPKVDQQIFQSWRAIFKARWKA